MKTSRAGLDLIKKWEGTDGGKPVLTSYQCSAEKWTIGWGHTKDVQENQTCTPEQAEAMLREDLQWAERAVNTLVRVQISQPMFDALVSLTFNIGAFAFERSTLLRVLNHRDYLGAANQFPMWKKSKGKTLPGLVKRREDEKQMFLSGMKGLFDE